MQAGSRKRVVSACTPCYTKKQKCNRRFPCNNCARRRRPEECIYNHAPASKALQTENRPADDTVLYHGSQSEDASGKDDLVGSRLDCNTANQSGLIGHEGSSLAELFGYVEHSDSNTMALARKLGLDEDQSRYGDRDVSPEMSDRVKEHVRALPSREILDFLVQYYVKEVHWMDQVVYAPWFVGQYQLWWDLERLSKVFDIEFAVLFLRISSYASQFLPSPTYTIDRIRGIPLHVVRDSCHNVAEKLAALCAQADARGALIRVQHLSILGLQRQCEGRIDALWGALSDAVRVAQRIGLHRGRAAWVHGMHDFDKEIRCRVFCNLVVLDRYGSAQTLEIPLSSNDIYYSYVSRQLDCPPLISTSLTSEHLPHSKFPSNVNDADTPDTYSARMMEVLLANFWRSLHPQQGSEYEPIIAEERYEKFCSNYLTCLPPTFALEPSKEWDERAPRVPLQRKILHVAMFESLCHNFRPILFYKLDQVQNLPAYKQVLIALQRRTLAAAGFKMLRGVSELHAMLGRCHTRLAAIILPTFEAAIVLMSLLMDELFLGPNSTQDEPPRMSEIDPLGEERTSLTRDRCYQAVCEALARLEMLAEISNMAKVGASTLTRLVAKLPKEATALGPSL